jgi:hypothetical protein
MAVPSTSTKLIAVGAEYLLIRAKNQYVRIPVVPGTSITDKFDGLDTQQRSSCCKSLRSRTSSNTLLKQYSHIFGDNNKSAVP